MSREADFKWCDREHEAAVCLEFRGSEVPGKILYTPDSGIALACSSVTYSISDALGNIFGDKKYGTLHARTTAGKRITLFDSFISNQVHSESGLSEFALASNSMVYGASVKCPDDPVVNWIQVGFTSLSAWSWSPAVRLSVELDASTNRLSRLVADAARTCTSGFCDRMSREVFAVCNDVRSKNIEGDRGVSLIEDRVVRYSTGSAMSVNKVMDAVFSMQSLLTVLCGHQVYVQFVGMSVGVEDPCFANLLLPYPQPRGSLESSVNKAKLEVLTNEFVLREQLFEIWSKWKKLWSDQREALELMMHTDIYHGHSSAFEFLAITQSLERYHRSKYSGLYMPADEYQEAVAQMVASIPGVISPDHRTSLKSRLKYGNEISLRSRFGQVLGDLPKEVSDYLIGDPKQFANKVIDTRNYLTHYSDELKSASLTGVELHYATRVIKWVLGFSILSDLGIETGRPLDRFKSIYRHRHVVDLVKSRLRK